MTSKSAAASASLPPEVYPAIISLDTSSYLEKRYGTTKHMHGTEPFEEPNKLPEWPCVTLESFAPKGASTFTEPQYQVHPMDHKTQADGTRWASSNCFKFVVALQSNLQRPVVRPMLQEDRPMLPIHYIKAHFFEMSLAQTAPDRTVELRTYFPDKVFIPLTAEVAKQALTFAKKGAIPEVTITLPVTEIHSIMERYLDPVPFKVAPTQLTLKEVTRLRSLVDVVPEVPVAPKPGLSMPPIDLGAIDADATDCPATPESVAMES